MTHLEGKLNGLQISLQEFLPAGCTVLAQLSRIIAVHHGLG